MSKEEFEKLEEKADALEKVAGLKCNAEVQRAETFYEGYQKGLRDLLGCVSQTD